MNLRHRLTCVFIGLAVFGVVSTTAAVYGIKLQLGSAVAEFQASVDRTRDVDFVRRAAREQVLQLREMLDGRRAPSDSYDMGTARFFDRIGEVAGAADALDAETAARVRGAGEGLQGAFRAFHRHLAAGRRQEAGRVLDNEVQAVRLPALNAALRDVSLVLEREQPQSVTDVTSTTALAIAMAVVVGGIGAGLVVLGAVLTRRWLFEPLADLHDAASAYRNGDFTRRTHLARRDELGNLAGALNGMACSIADAQRRLAQSERKYRDLFDNLRDAVVICNADGRIAELHDGQPRLLERGGDVVGKHVLEAWPEWSAAFDDWQEVFDGVVGSGRRFRADEVELSDQRVADFLVYPLVDGSRRLAAVVLWDAAERVRLHRRLRHAEVMKATGTLAGGMAHDINNLLTNTISSIAAVQRHMPSANGQGKRLDAALRACWQAAGLTRRLLNFAGSAHGRPEVIHLASTVELILDSLDGGSLGGVQLVTELDPAVHARIDRDQLTQTVLNLVQNATDAMPDGGTLTVRVHRETKVKECSQTAGPGQAVLTVSDTGCGMSAETMRRLYEPFYTTKPRDTHRGRGLGMAVVYAVVQSADGQLHVDSELQKGTMITVRLPAAEPAGVVARDRGAPNGLSSVRVDTSIHSSSSGSRSDSM